MYSELWKQPRRLGALQKNDESQHTQNQPPIDAEEFLQECNVDEAVFHLWENGKNLYQVH